MKASRTSGCSLFSLLRGASTNLSTSRSRVTNGLDPTAATISRIQSLASGASSGAGNRARNALCTASGSITISSSDEGDQLDKVDLGIFVEIKLRVQFRHLVSIDEHQKTVLLEARPGAAALHFPVERPLGLHPET